MARGSNTSLHIRASRIPAKGDEPLSASDLMQPVDGGCSGSMFAAWHQQGGDLVGLTGSLPDGSEPVLERHLAVARASSRTWTSGSGTDASCHDQRRVRGSRHGAEVRGRLAYVPRTRRELELPRHGGGMRAHGPGRADAALAQPGGAGRGQPHPGAARDRQPRGAPHPPAVGWAATAGLHRPGAAPPAAVAPHGRADGWRRREDPARDPPRPPRAQRRVSARATTHDRRVPPTSPRLPTGSDRRRQRLRVLTPSSGATYGAPMDFLDTPVAPVGTIRSVVIDCSAVRVRFS